MSENGVAFLSFKPAESTNGQKCVQTLSEKAKYHIKVKNGQIFIPERPIQPFQSRKKISEKKQDGAARVAGKRADLKPLRNFRTT